MIVLFAQPRPAAAQNVAPVLRGRALEIVDDQGRTRATLNVQSDSVLLRLITERGRPTV